MTQRKESEVIDTEVLVVGAGPVGLSLAGDLGWRGHSCIIVERGDGLIYQPKMDQVGIRTMEFCRRWGIVADVEASPYNRDYPQDNIYVTSLNGWELGREFFPSMRTDQPPPYSPQKRERCPQNMFDPILRKFAESHESVQLKLRHKLVALTQDDQGVTATVQDLEHDREVTIRARYVVGCDGGRSRVREQLGIIMSGRGLLTYTTNVIFRCENFDALHHTKPGYRYIFLGPEGTWGTLVAINGRDQWRMSLIGNAQENKTYTEDELKAFAWRAMGKPFELEILSILPWQRYELVADTYRKGRCFLAGDSCHLTSPTGGLGMNTGIGDAVDLGWKLSAMLEGWGGPKLLDSYEIERRPVAQRIVNISTKNLQLMKSPGKNDKLLEDSEEGRATRERVGKSFSEAMKREWFLMNVHLGYRYIDSPVVVYEPEDPEQLAREAAETANYEPTTQPGRRAPHAWLADGRSTHDLFGKTYVLVDTGAQGADEREAALLNAATTRAVPMQVARWPEPAIAGLYQTRYVLVRPDDTVAWRGDRLPQDTAALLATVTGH
ncbi:FAD-dependent oxidoreductase [Achromobacter denitrificans]|uniref:FAD-dependent oxidoreductase n=1 Tax=Achromobacter denitrificans TaxID=32002 RepID=A0ABZ3G9Z8_ACHDE|nr:2-polyprenyl-6-methoxyphenol hydroxylase [Achromobacter denitrificans]